jgi:hypothetical protein
MSSRAPDRFIRPILVFVLLASALKLLDMPSTLLGATLLAVALLALPIWGAIDAAGHPEAHWEQVGLRRRTWIRLQAWLAPIGIGFPCAVTYFARVRPQLLAVGRGPEAVPVVVG